MFFHGFNAKKDSLSWDNGKGKLDSCRFFGEDSEQLKKTKPVYTLQVVSHHCVASLLCKERPAASMCCSLTLEAKLEDWFVSMSPNITTTYQLALTTKRSFFSRSLAIPKGHISYRDAYGRLIIPSGDGIHETASLKDSIVD